MIQPKYNAVIVKPLEGEEETYGNIIIPDLGADKTSVGIVVGVGTGHNLAGVGFIPTETKVGEKVILPGMGFTKFYYKDEEYWIGPENSLLGTITEDIRKDKIDDILLEIVEKHNVKTEDEASLRKSLLEKYPHLSYTIDEIDNTIESEGRYPGYLTEAEVIKFLKDTSIKA